MRAELPKIPARFDATKEMVAGKWTIPMFLRLVKASKLRDQAIYLTLFQGFMDQKRFWIFNKKGFELGEYIKKKGVDSPYRIEFMKGRKGNRKPFNTWIGRDALQGWKDYFESGRGYPKPGEPAAIVGKGKGVVELDPETLASNHRYRLEDLGLKTVSHDSGTRYGYGIHELRDLGRSLAERAKTEVQGFNEKSVEFWMGHEIDPYDYNKIWKLDSEYNLNQYRIAEKYLNILSGPIETTPMSVKEMVTRIMTNKEGMDTLAQALMERAGLGFIKLENREKYEKILSGQIDEETLVKALQNNPALNATIAKGFFKDRATVREFFGRLADDGLVIRATKAKRSSRGGAKTCN